MELKDAVVLVVDDEPVRWAEPDECLLRVEILNLDERCRDWVIGLIAVNAGSSYIPRVPLSAAQGSKTAK